jgi:hypothetical protein
MAGRRERRMAKVKPPSRSTWFIRTVMRGQVGLSESKRAEDPPNGPKTMASYVTKQWALGIIVPVSIGIIRHSDM